MVHKLLALLILLFVQNSLKAQDTFDANVLKVTADYTKDTKSNLKDEILFIWVNEIELDLFKKLKNEQNTFTNQLPGYKSGLLVAKGQFLQEIFDFESLKSSSIQSLILQKYVKAKVTNNLTKEEQLLGQMPSPYATRNLVIKPQVSWVRDLTQPGMHKHKCGDCGTVWAHKPGGSHYCPNCGHGKWLEQYEGSRPATYIH